MLTKPSTETLAGTRPAPKRAPANLTRERVLEVHHYTDTLFSFRTTRSASLRFENGQFVMIGLEVDGRPLLRAYSIASANYEDHLDFYSIKVPHGPLTSRLQHIAPGDELLVGSKPTGTLLLGNLLSGKRIYLLSTGTGFAPFSGILRDPDIYERFETVVSVQGCRTVAELAYAEATVATVLDDEYLAEAATGKLRFYPTATRETFRNQGRLTDLIATGHLSRDLGLPRLDPAEDRVMICGSSAMLTDLKDMLLTQGFREGSSGEPAEFVIERAFVER